MCIHGISKHPHYKKIEDIRDESLYLILNEVLKNILPSPVADIKYCKQPSGAEIILIQSISNLEPNYFQQEAIFD